MQICGLVFNLYIRHLWGWHPTVCVVTSPPGPPHEPPILWFSAWVHFPNNETHLKDLSKARDWFPKGNGNHRWWKTVGWPRLHNCTPSFCASPRLDSWELSFSFRSPGTSSPSNAYSTQTHWKPTKGWKAGKLQDKHSGKRVLGEQYTEPVLSDALPQSLEK